MKKEGRERWTKKEVIMVVKWEVEKEQLKKKWANKLKTRPKKNLKWTKKRKLKKKKSVKWWAK